MKYKLDHIQCVGGAQLVIHCTSMLFIKYTVNMFQAERTSLNLYSFFIAVGVMPVLHQFVNKLPSPYSDVLLNWYCPDNVCIAPML